MQYLDCPQVLREFLAYHETIKGQSQKTISEYYLDLRMFLRFMVLIKSELPYQTPLDTISIKAVDLGFISKITVHDVYDFLTYLANDRPNDIAKNQSDTGIGSAARARKLSSIKSFFKYLTVRTKQLSENPVKDMEFPKLRRTLPKYLTLEQSVSLLQSIDGTNATRDYAIIMIFLSTGIRLSELVGLNLNDVYEDHLRVVGKGNKERIVYFGSACHDAIEEYLVERNKMKLSDPNALFASRDHNRISVSAVHRMVKKHFLSAGLDMNQFSAHKLRHTAATLMLSNGVDLKTVQEVLGHEHLNTTEIYTHIESTELRIAAQANPLSKVHLKNKI